MYQQTTYWALLIKKNLFQKNKKGKGIMSNDKYYEKAKEVEAIFKKKKRGIYEYMFNRKPNVNHTICKIR